MEPQLSFREHNTEIRDIVSYVFTTMLGLDTEPVEIEWRESKRSITSAIYFAGPWKGAVMIECTREEAFAFTGILCGVRPTQLDETVRDAFGELANMVGGNLKAIMPRGVNLSMPMVVEGSDYLIWFSGGNIVSRMAFRCEIGTFWLYLIETQPKEVPEATITLSA